MDQICMRKREKSLGGVNPSSLSNWKKETRKYVRRLGLEELDIKNPT